METTSNDFKLWSPPLLDLSLDSFSNDLFQEFDKTRLNIQDGNESNQAQIQDKIPLSSSHISTSSVTLPSPSKEASLQQSQQQQNEGEDSSSTANLFRKSSTFLKKKLSTNSSQRNSAISTCTTNNAEDISSIVSRQYPPKPLQYSPIIEPPSDKISRNSRDSANVLTTTEEAPEEEQEQGQGQEVDDDVEKQDNDKEQEEKKVINPTPPSPSAVYTTASPPIAAITTPLEKSITSNQAAPVSNATNSAVKSPITSVPTSNTPKRRSFFSLRFC